MAPNETDDEPARTRPGAATREADRTALREARLAEALRANLKRRKDQARARGAGSPPAVLPEGDADAGTAPPGDGRLPEGGP